MKIQRQLFEELREEHEKEFRIRNMFQRYVPEDIVNKVLNNSNEIFVGKKVKATVLMCDIRNSTAFTRKFDPENVVSMLNNYFREMSNPIYKNGGIVDKYIGDAIMGVFGAPAGKDNDAENALITAWELLACLKKFNSKNKAIYGELVVGMGINTGEVVAGNIGFERKMEYTVMGDAVHIASKIEELSKEHANGILISGATFSEAEDIVEVENLGNLLPDRADEVIYKVTAVKI